MKLKLIVLICLLWSFRASAFDDRQPMYRECPIPPSDQERVPVVTGLRVPANGQAHLGDPIVVWVCELDTLIKASPDGLNGIHLFINGRDTGLVPKAIEPVAYAVESGAAKQVTPEVAKQDAAKGDAVKPDAATKDVAKPDPAKDVNAGLKKPIAPRALTFRLERIDSGKDANGELWRDILRNPFSIAEEGPLVTVSVGPAGGEPVKIYAVNGKPAAMQFYLDQIRIDCWGVIWIVILAIAVIGFVILAISTAILRDGPDFRIANNKTVHQPYSLARCQMAFWFFLILIGYVVIWTISGNRDTITESLLTLMGISAGTALGAVAVSSMSESRVSAARTRLTSEKLALDVSIADLGAQLAPVQGRINAANTAGNAPAPADVKLEHDLSSTRDDLDARRTLVLVRLANLVGPIESDWFLNDILTDENGAIAFHRFQIAVWTVVLGLIFVASVVRDLSMPQFSATLLALMGISATTYIGFKLPTAQT